MHNNKKRILIIAINQSERESGGIEQYNRKLIKLFSNEFIIDEFNFIKTSDVQNPLLNAKHFIIDQNCWQKKNWFYRNFYYRKVMEKELYNYLKDKHYDVFINATNICFSKISQDNGYVFVVHFDPVFISNSNLGENLSDRIKTIIFHFLLKLFNQRNPLINSKNIVTFFQSFIPKQYINLESNYCYIPIAKYSIKEIDSIWQKYNDSFFDKQKGNLLFLGRIENHQKNVKFLIDNFSNTDYYGIIEDSELLPKIKNYYKGILSNNQELQNAFLKHSYTILASKYEGFPNVFVESLSNCTPIISSSLIKANEFFNIEKNKIGFILDMSQIRKYKQMQNLINLLPYCDYKNMCINSYKFARKNLTIESFNKTWKKFIGEILNR